MPRITRPYKGPAASKKRVFSVCIVAHSALNSHVVNWLRIFLAVSDVIGCAGMSQNRHEHGSPASVQIRPAQSPTASTPGLTPELRQLINADVDVRRAASLDNGCDSSDMDSGDRFHVSCSTLSDLCSLLGSMALLLS